MDEFDLPKPLQQWIERTMGASIQSATRHFAGASRHAWNIDLVPEASAPNALFLLCDKGGAGGSARDAAVLRALDGGPVPVPRVLGIDEASGALLLERIQGRSDFPNVDQESEREPTARHLMELTGQLHRLDPDKLSISHLSLPRSAHECGALALEPIRAAVTQLGDSIDPFFAFALGWIERHVPTEVPHIALIHSDMGPGNFLFEGGRVTGIIDWEVAHFGDPMEDLAAIAVRDMATPIGSLPIRFREYAAASGIPVDLERVGFYRALVLTRNSLMIGLGLAHPPPGFDFVEMTMFHTLLIRAAALVLCDNLGIDRPASDVGNEEDGLLAQRSPLLAALQTEFTQTIMPAIHGDLATRRADGIARALESVAHEDRIAVSLDRQERDDLASVLGQRPDSVQEGERALRQRLMQDAPPNAETEERLACYFARRFERLAERRRPLMGTLWERLPQPLS